ncbi:MAG: 2OG-Fe(II) oxygenase [Rubrivivax sp.]
MTATSQTITDELRRWIVAQAEAGCRPQDVVQAMKASGWDEDVAIGAMEQTLRQHLQLTPVDDAAEPAADSAASAPANRVPQPELAGASEITLSDGHTVRVLTAQSKPRLIVFGGLLSDAECDALMDEARPKLSRSETVDNATGGSEINAARTSDGMFFERAHSPLIAAIEERIAELLRWPVEHGEGLQILRYHPGAEYRPHHDYFDPVHPGTPKILERGGQRVGTLIVYLNTPLAGGATVFPDVGVDVSPLRGNAVFFSYDRPHVSTKTLHGGAPVTAGEKWVATKWLREGVFS